MPQQALSRRRPLCSFVSSLPLLHTRQLLGMVYASVFLGALLAVVGYMAVSVARAIFFAPKPREFAYQPRQVGDVTAEELSKYCGVDPSRPLLMAVRGRVFDVTQGAAFYGAGAAQGWAHSCAAQRAAAFATRRSRSLCRRALQRVCWA